MFMGIEFKFKQTDPQAVKAVSKMKTTPPLCTYLPRTHTHIPPKNKTIHPIVFFR